MIEPIHSFIHCRTCVTTAQTERLQIGITRAGIRIQCPKHGLVGHLTPAELATQVARGPQCACCPGGTHRS